MGAIAKHKTAVVDEKWDGSANEKKLKADQDYSYYAKMYAWVDPEGDKSTKSAYKFPHHMVSDEGTPGAANIKACISAIGVLNGARGGTKIPDGDVQGVYNHVASHLKDADVEPPELKSFDGDYIEIRTFKAEIRKDGEEEKPKIKGTAAVFNQYSADLCGFKEIIRPGAFGDLINTDDVFALKNHDENLVLGRNRSGTLKLEENDNGLDFVIYPPDTTYANDLLVSMERGDMDKCSFAFVVDDESVKWYNKDGTLIRDVSRMKELWDISVVTYPAFPQTSAQVLFNKRIKTPEQVYAEYKSRNMVQKPELKQERLVLAKRKLQIYEKMNGEKK